MRSSLVAFLALFFSYSSSLSTNYEVSRRQNVFEGIGVASALLSTPVLAASDKSTLIKELKESQEKLQPIPDLLEKQEWDAVRSILKVPPVNKLWNLGDVRFP